uniref:Tail protein n=1 Tax=viral metagenome TaxID=1070528 RepID=A0A6H1ZEX5_9ZZZZ
MGTSKPTVVVGSATKKTDYDAAIDFVSEPEELNGDAGITLTIANFGCCVRVNSAVGQAVTLPSIGAGDVGGWFVVYRLGAGAATITRADADNLYANGVAGTTYAVAQYEAVLIRCIALDKWAIEGAIRITDHGGLSGLGDDDHSQYFNTARGDARYFTEAEHINIGAGAGDAGKPIKLNASGYVDPTMVSAGGVDHGSLGGLADNDHPQYFMPVGVIMAWLGGYFADGSNGTYTKVLGATNDVAGANGYVNPYWHVCNGAALNDAGSPIFNGALRYLPNLTDDRFIMGSTVAGGIGGSSTMAHTHTVDPASVTSGAGSSHGHGSNAKTSGAGSAHGHGITGAITAEAVHTHAVAGTSTVQSVGHVHGMSGHTHGISLVSHTHGGVAAGTDISTAADGAATPTIGPNVVDTTGISASHKHTFSVTSAAGASHTHAHTLAIATEAAHTHGYNQSDSAEAAHTHAVDVAITTSSAASNAENRPLFLGCFYIMKVK